MHNLNNTKFDQIVFGRRLVHPIFQYWTGLFSINSNIFRHLKLEIALQFQLQMTRNTIKAIQQDQG